MALSTTGTSSVHYSTLTYSVWGMTDIGVVIGNIKNHVWQNLLVCWMR